MKKISLILSQYIDNQNISQYRLAKDAGVNIGTVRSYYRNEVRRYDADVLEKICTFLNCELTDIVKCVDIDE